MLHVNSSLIGGQLFLCACLWITDYNMGHDPLSESSPMVGLLLISGAFECPVCVCGKFMLCKMWGFTMECANHKFPVCAHIFQKCSTNTPLMGTHWRALSEPSPMVGLSICLTPLMGTHWRALSEPSPMVGLSNLTWVLIGELSVS